MASSGGEADAGADLRALFMADLTPGALNASGVASASASSSSSNHLGWGGVAIDSSAASIPWFGRRRGPARQPRGRAAGGLGGDGSTSSGSGSRPPTAGAAAPGGVGDWPGGGGGGGAAPGQQPGSQHAHHQQPQRQQQDPGMSVQEIVGLLKRTPRAEPVPPRIHAALHALDSRAVALLLKDVSKAGLDGRSIELFDWLRALPERHLLAPLCDVYTYTAAISLCIYQQNADRAMELLREMCSRGVERNVHTYTALMNVCIKCGRLSAALDIFSAMKGEGCTPNVVTFNTLIDVHGKLGQWDKAVGVLGMMREEGVSPALRTYNTLIIACNMCNQPREALAVYQQLRDSGFEANSTTYNALISAHGKLGQLDRVLEVYQDMVWRGLERSVITYSSLISACEKAGRWETALQLFEEMTRDGCSPNTVTYNSLITACGQGGQWEKARQVFGQLQASGCSPDVVTYTALISAYERGGQWLLALAAFEEMGARGCRPDAIIYNAIIDALWQTGVVWAQRKARELFMAAVKQGHFRNERVAPDNSRAELNLHALTAGVAMLSLHAWLQEIQAKVAAAGDACLPVVLAIVTDAGSASKEQGNFIIKDAASTSMAFWGSPFRAVQDRTYLGVLEAAGPQLAAWVRSTSFATMMASLFPPMPEPQQQGQQPGQQQGQQGLVLSSVQQHELAALQECCAAFEAVRHFEASHNLALQHMGPAFVQHRGALVSAILDKGGALGLLDEVVHDAVLLLDRIGSTGVQVAQDALLAVAAATLHTCVHQNGDAAAAAAPSLAAVADAFGVPAQAVVDMGWQLRQVLQNDTLAISAMRCLKVYLERLGCRHLDQRGVYVMAGLPIMLAVEAQFDSALLNCRPSVVAAALLYAERRQRGAVPFWPSMLAKLTGYEDLTAPEVASAVRAAQKLCRKVHYTQVYKAQSARLAASAAGGGGGTAAHPQTHAQQQQQQQQQQQAAAAGNGVMLLMVPPVPTSFPASSGQVVCVSPVPLPSVSLSAQPPALTAQGLAGMGYSAGGGAAEYLPSSSGLPSNGAVATDVQLGSLSQQQGAFAAPASLGQLQCGPQLNVAMLAQAQQLQQQQQQQQQQQLAMAAGAHFVSAPMPQQLGIGGLQALQLPAPAGPGVGAGSVLVQPQQQPQPQQQAHCYVEALPGGAPLLTLAAPGASSALTVHAAAAAARMLGPAGALQPGGPNAQQQQQGDATGLQHLAFSLSALGLDGQSDAAISAEVVEAALGGGQQQRVMLA